MTIEENKYGAWLTEDLKDFYDELLQERRRSEEYSDRVEINNMIKIILSEIKRRGKSE
jgi:hypothetical protein